jgi:G3E family GTPase
MSDEDIEDFEALSREELDSSTDFDNISCGDGMSMRDASATEDAIPVTILSGFLGAGKTSLFRHVLRSTEHQLKVAVIVNDMAELNIDGENIRQVKKEVIMLQNGCICCTLRGDLIREINRVQAIGTFDYVIVESTGIAEPQQVAESFCADPDTQELAEDLDHALWKVARLDTCVTVIDARDFPRHLASLHRFKDKFRDGLDSEAVGEEGEKKIANLLVEQVEFANVIVLNKTDLVSPKDLESTKRLLQVLNPKATIVTTQHGVVDPSCILNTRLFSMEEAEKSPGWLVSLGNQGFASAPALSESEEYGVVSFVYRARKPFHPNRLHHWIEQGFVMNEGGKSSTAIESTEAQCTINSLYGQVLRSKGFCWIAGRDSHTAGWESAGQLFSLVPMSPWYATKPEDEWDTEGDDDHAAIRAKFEGEHGDRRQEIVFIGINLQEGKITETLNSCLLSDEEMRSHTNSCEGRYLDTLPPWTFHYADPCVVSTVLRSGQVHKFEVEPSVSLTLSNVAMFVADASETTMIVRVWLDFVTERNERTSSTLLATLRSGSVEQHSLHLVIPGTANEDYNGPMTLRAECISRHNEPSIKEFEVYVTGSAVLLETDNGCDEEGPEDDDHHDHGHIHKRHKTTNGK